MSGTIFEAVADFDVFDIANVPAINSIPIKTDFLNGKTVFICFHLLLSHLTGQKPVSPKNVTTLEADSLRIDDGSDRPNRASGPGESAVPYFMPPPAFVKSIFPRLSPERERFQPTVFGFRFGFLTFIPGSVAGTCKPFSLAMSMPERFYYIFIFKINRI